MFSEKNVWFLPYFTIYVTNLVNWITQSGWNLCISQFDPTWFHFIHCDNLQFVVELFSTRILYESVSQPRVKRDTICAPFYPRLKHLFIYFYCEFQIIKYSFQEIVDHLFLWKFMVFILLSVGFFKQTIIFFSTISVAKLHFFMTLIIIIPKIMMENDFFQNMLKSYNAYIGCIYVTFRLNSHFQCGQQKKIALKPNFCKK
jgi:hypothetical protein